MLRFDLIILAWLFLALLPMSVHAQSYEDAKQAYEQENYEVALRLLEAEADAGNEEAKLFLGKMFARGYGVAPDKLKAFDYFKAYSDSLSWEQEEEYNHVIGEINTLHQDPLFRQQWTARYEATRDGQGEQAINLFTKGMNAKNSGQFEQALEFFLKASEQYHVGSMRELGHLYANGVGVDASYAEARRWYIEAIERGDAEAETSLVDLTQSTFGTLQDAWARYYSGDYRSAFPTLLAYAEIGRREAQSIVGLMYRDGKGVDVDLQSASDWFQRANTGEANYYNAILAFGGGIRTPDEFYSLQAYGLHLMQVAKNLNYGPAVEFVAAQEAAQEEWQMAEQLKLAARQQEDAEAEARRLAHIEKYGRNDVSDPKCDNPVRVTSLNQVTSYLTYSDGTVVCR